MLDQENSSVEEVLIPTESQEHIFRQDAVEKDNFLTKKVKSLDSSDSKCVMKSVLHLMSICFR